MSWFIAALKKYVVFGGRSRRKEYWYFALFGLIIATVLTIIDGVIGTFNPDLGLGLLSGIYSLAILISFVPLIGTIILLVFAVLEGTPGNNRYGPDPKTAVT